MNEEAAAVLLTACERKFEPLSPAERTLVTSFAIDEIATCGDSTRFAHDVDAEDAPVVRADLLRWLLVSAQVAEWVGSQPLRVFAAVVREALDLSRQRLLRPLELYGCALARGMDFEHAKCMDLYVVGGYLLQFYSYNLEVEGDVSFSGLDAGDGVVDELYCDGSMTLYSARIAGNFVTGECQLRPQWSGEGRTYLRSLDTDACLSLRGARVGGDLRLRRNTIATSRVDLTEVIVEGDVRVEGAVIMSPLRPRSLQLFRASVSGAVELLEGTVLVGRVDLRELAVGRSLLIENTKATASPTEPREEGLSPADLLICADGATIAGSVRIRDAYLPGWIACSGARIEGDLELHDSEFSNDINPVLAALHQRITPEQEFHPSEPIERATGLRADRAVIGRELVWRPAEPLAGGTVLDLRQTTVVTLADRKESWPQTAGLSIDGFAYSGFSPGSPVGEERIEWLERQAPDTFSAQPYSHLIRVLRQHGQEEAARFAAIAKQERRRKYGGLSGPRRLWAWILKVVIGYGYRPAQSLLWAAAVIFVGWVAFAAAQRLGVLQPAAEQAMSEFHPMVYSLDLFVPVVDLDQAAEFTVTSATGAKAFFRWYHWFHILVGWILSTLAVLGFSGVVRQD